MSALETRFRTAGAAAREAASQRRIPAWFWPAKRVIDVTVAGVGLVLTSPILILAMAGIVGFVVVHLLLVALVPRTLPAMLTGRARVPLSGEGML